MPKFAVILPAPLALSGDSIEPPRRFKQKPTTPGEPCVTTPPHPIEQTLRALYAKHRSNLLVAVSVLAIAGTGFSYAVSSYAPDPASLSAM